jgi:hypothetical protein
LLTVTPPPRPQASVLELGAQLLFDQLVSFGVKRGAGLLGLHRGDELVLRTRMAASAASAPRWSGSKLITFGDRAVDGV